MRSRARAHFVVPMSMHDVRLISCRAWRGASSFNRDIYHIERFGDTRWHICILSISLFLYSAHQIEPVYSKLCWEVSHRLRRLFAWHVRRISAAVTLPGCSNRMQVLRTCLRERVRLKYALISLGGDLLRTAERNVLAVL